MTSFVGLLFDDIAGIATAFGVLVALYAVRAANAQRRRQFETIYVQRYWELMDRLSLDAQKGCDPTTLGGSDTAAVLLDSHVSETDQRVVRSYLRLCEDELELRREGWISRDTWAIWETGITAQISRWPFKQVWRELDQQIGAKCPSRTPEEFEQLRKFLSEGGRDPLKNVSRGKRMGRFVRRALTGAP